MEKYKEYYKDISVKYGVKLDLIIKIVSEFICCGFSIEEANTLTERSFIMA